MRIIVHTQYFENYNTDNWKSSVMHVKFKGGSEYACIVPDDTRLENVVLAMYRAIACMNHDDELTSFGSQEFPISWEQLKDDELTKREKDYISWGDKPVTYIMEYKDGLAIVKKG